MQRNGGKGSQGAERKNTSIINLFSALREKQQKKVACPVCSTQVPYTNINKHLDTECTTEISTDDVKIIQEIKLSPDILENNAGKDRENIMYEKNKNMDEKNKNMDEKNKNMDEKNKKIIGKNKKRKAVSQAQQIKRPRQDSEEFSDDDAFISAVDNAKDVVQEEGSCDVSNPSSSQKENFSPNPAPAAREERTVLQVSSTQTRLNIEQSSTKRSSQSPSHSSQTFQSTQSSQSSMTFSQETITLSPSISYNPARYGGIDNISPDRSQLVRSGSKSAGDKYSPKKSSNSSPQNARKNLFGGRPEIPQHDPFTPTKRRDPDYTPYYVTNFEYILACVLDCTDDRELFNQEELSVVESYRTLPLRARKLYVRLFNRKHAWISETNIKYDECPEIEKSACILVSAGLLLDKMQLDDLSDSLNILHTPEIKTIAKEFNVSPKISNKHEIIDELKKMCSKKTMFQTSSSLLNKVLRRAKSLGGNCYKLQTHPRSVLNRILCLWGVSQWWNEREDDRPPNSLTSLFLFSNQGRATFPLYNIIRERRVFRDREDLVRFEAAVRLEDKVETALNNKDWEAGYTAYKDILAEYERLQLDSELMRTVEDLPIFLRKLTAPAVLAYGLSRCVELLEKMKNYSEAVILLEKLLLTDFLYRYRGVWYERLCLDLETHLKRPMDALGKIELALQDKMVRGGRRLSLSQRILKICRSKKNANLETKLEEYQGREDWQDPSSQDLPVVVISGKMVSKDGVSGTKSIFMLTTPDGGTTYCNVEELVREHYKDQGLYEGSHAEGAVLNSILGLLFWDEIYLEKVPDAFRDPTQTIPLDFQCAKICSHCYKIGQKYWDTDDFYPNRKDVIDARLKQIAECSGDEVCRMLVDSYTTNFNVSSIVSWDRFRGSEHLAGLIKCIPPLQLSLILERLIKDHRTYRSGLPDLTLWNPETEELKFVEVKGPGDKLSFKQILWIRFFLSIGVCSEVCHVDPTGSLDARGFKQSTKKYSPLKEQKTLKIKKNRKTSNSDFVEDFDEKKADSVSGISPLKEKKINPRKSGKESKFTKSAKCKRRESIEEDAITGKDLTARKARVTKKT